MTTQADPLREALEALLNAAKYTLTAIDTGRSEPLYIARDSLRNAVNDYQAALAQSPAPHGEGMREALQRAIAIVESEPEFPGLQEEVEREIKAGFDWDDLRQFPLSEICAKSMLVACRETKECIANRLREEITTLAATPIPSDKAGREEEIADEQVDAFVDAYLEAISCTEKFAPDPDGVCFGLAAALRQSASAGPEGHDQPCYYCGEPCDSLAGNPNRWPIPLCHKDEPGKLKWHHSGCVTDRLIENNPASASAGIERAAELAERYPDIPSLVDFAKQLRSLSSSASRE